MVRGATKTTARLEDGQWVINGSKAFITNSGTRITSHVTVTAVTGRDESTGKREISAILVPSGTDGFTVAPSYSKVGWNASDTHELAFSDCRVPEENLVGQRGKGYGQFLSILDEGRVAIAALATGAAQGCVDESVRYAHERKQFDKEIAEFQAIQWKLADMRTELDASHLLCMRAAWLKEQGRLFAREASMSKVFASEAAVRIANDAVQVHGGYGYTREFAAEGCERVVVIDGAEFVQQLITIGDCTTRRWFEKRKRFDGRQMQRLHPQNHRCQR